MKGMLDALMRLAEQGERDLTLGLLGDHRQRIYAHGDADLPSLVPQNWATPELQFNHRSQRRIVTLINKVWEAEREGRTQPTNGVEQHPRIEKAGGVVRLYVGDTSRSPEGKVLGERWCSDRMHEATATAAWNQSQYKLLALEHKLVATRGSFLDVYVGSVAACVFLFRLEKKQIRKIPLSALALGLVVIILSANIPKYTAEGVLNFVAVTLSVRDL